MTVYVNLVMTALFYLTQLHAWAVQRPNSRVCSVVALSAYVSVQLMPDVLLVHQ
jgi:hypothetical protein